MQFKISHVAPNDPELRRTMDGIMRRVYRENPEYWPYGLCRQHHDDLYLVMDKQANQPAGFVGWQGALEWEGVNPIRTGYYTIGILPEFRSRGIAKEAVSKMIMKKASEYDRVKAYIVPSNTPSIRLAESLGVEVTHKAAHVNVKTAGYRNIPEHVRRAMMAGDKELLSELGRRGGLKAQELRRTSAMTDAERLVDRLQSMWRRDRNHPDFRHVNRHV